MPVSNFQFHALLIVGASALASAPTLAQSVQTGAQSTPAVYSAHLPSLRGAMAQTEGIGSEHRVRQLRQIPLVSGAAKPATRWCKARLETAPL